MRFIFLSYVNRSGSTFLANQLSKSKEICVCPEAHILLELFLISPHKTIHPKTKDRLKKLFIDDKKYNNWRLDAEALKDIKSNFTNFDCFCHIINYYLKINAPAAHIIVFKAERLIELYNNYTSPSLFQKNILWISLIRDCRAVYNSQRRTNWPGSNKKMSNNPVRTAIFWKTFVKKTVSYQKQNNFLVIKYENLISQPDITISEIGLYFNIKLTNLLAKSGTLFPRLHTDHKKLHCNIDSLPIEDKITKWEFLQKKNDTKLIEIIAGEELSVFDYNLKDYAFSKVDYLKSYIFKFYDILLIKVMKTKFKLRYYFKGY